MEVETSRFGTVTVEPDAIITLTQPIIGFAEFRRFVLLPSPGNEGVCWLQSTDRGDLAFLLLSPTVVLPDYQVTLGRGELTELAAENVEALEVYTLLVVPKDPQQIRTNLRAPILINRRHRLGKQTVLDKTDYPIQFFLAQAHRGLSGQKEQDDARTIA